MLVARPALGFSSAPRASRCFRTGPDGRIALTTNWPALLEEARAVGTVAVQTRHPGARLVTFSPWPALTHDLPSFTACDDTGAFHFDFSTWHEARGYLRACPCCDSPGRVELRNAAGDEFLQFCPLPSTDPLHWADFLARVAAPADLMLHPETTSYDRPLFANLPLLPAHAIPLGPMLDVLPALLDAFGSESVPVRVSLRTAEVDHHRELIPHTVTCDDGLLTFGGNASRLQLALAVAQRLAVTSDSDGLALHVLGRSDAILLTVSAGSTERAALQWPLALRAIFPVLC